MYVLEAIEKVKHLENKLENFDISIENSKDKPELVEMFKEYKKEIKLELDSLNKRLKSTRLVPKKPVMRNSFVD